MTISKKIFFSALALCVILIPLFVSADPLPGPIKIDNPLKFESVSDLIFGIVDAATLLGIYVAVFFIIYSGFLFVKARGNPGEIGKARDAFLWAVVGTAILLGARVITDVIEGTLEQIRPSTRTEPWHEITSNNT